MPVRKWLVTASIVAVVSGAAPRTASADWTLTPFVGWNFGGSADVNGTGGSTFSNKFEKKLDYGASLMSMGGGPIGFEVDFGYSPNFFESSTTGTGFQFTSKSNVTTLTGNVVVGGRTGSVRPYVVGGVGLLRTNVQDAAQLFNANTKFVGVTHVSNALGTINPVKELIAISHSHGVPVLVDGAQAAPHLPVAGEAPVARSDRQVGGRGCFRHGNLQ